MVDALVLRPKCSECSGVCVESLLTVLGDNWECPGVSTSVRGSGLGLNALSYLRGVSREQSNIFHRD